MASKDSLRMRELAAVGAVVQNTSTGQGTNIPIAIRIRKIGSESATSVTISTATQIALVGSTTTDTLTFTGGSVNYNTVGALADAINATGRWECNVLDALRADTCINMFTDGLITAGTDGNGVVVWDVTVITTALKAVTVALTPRRNFDSPKRGHVVDVQEIQYYLTLGGAGANLVHVYQRNGVTETQILGYLSVSATKTTINWASGVGKITSADGGSIIVRVQDATGIAGTAGDYLYVAGLFK